MSNFVGMKEITINISRSDVLTAVRMASAYTGDRNTTDEEYRKFDLHKEDEELLEHYFAQEIANVVVNGRRFIKLVSTYYVTEDEEKVEGLSLTLNVSDLYNEQSTDKLKDAYTAYLKNAILADWFMIAKPDMVEGYKVIAQQQMQQAENILFYRTKPTRTTVTEEDAYSVVITDTEE